MELFKALDRALTDPTAGRMLGNVLGIVTSVDDPMGLHRVKVTTGDKGGLSESYWVMAVAAAPYLTLPTPNLGDTVVLGFMDADPHKPMYLGVLHNVVNPPSTNPGVTIDLPSGSTFTVRVGAVTLQVSEEGVTINGKAVTTLTAQDSRGDSLVTRGY